MPLSWNEIKDRALHFSRDWAGVESEHEHSQTFWNEFFEVFGVSRRRVANFESKVKKLDGKDGYIDLLWKGKLLVEQKSRSKDLDRAHGQARDYFDGLADHELPRYLLVCDFARFRLYDLDEGTTEEFKLEDLHRKTRLFGFLAGYTTQVIQPEDPVNVHAAERMGELHDRLKENGYEGHRLEVFLVRLLFCLFADDTGIFPTNSFHELISQRTGPDGADLGGWIARVFQVLNTRPSDRQATLDEDLLDLPYVNGKLFDEVLPIADFDSAMRDQLLEASALDWSTISPAVFGSLFQSVMDPELRRNLGAHYTSETNILKLIGPLFLDDLKAELEKIGNHENKLKSFHIKLSTLTFLDPACGCGNFLVIAYRELRLLELEVLRRLFARQHSVLTKVSEHVAVDVDQFYGIEIEEFPAQIAQLAMWLTDHQMNMQLSELFGEYFARLPLVKSATIVNGNALRTDWADVIPAKELSYILGNPPFGGHHYQSDSQKEDQRALLADIKACGVLDFVSNWFVKAADFMRASDSIRCAFVATNSITQGEQVGLLWPHLLSRGVHIHFAHRTFQWSSDGRGKAAVHCVIIGFGLLDHARKQLFEYEDVRGDPHAIQCANINPYLVDASDSVVINRSVPVCAVPRMKWGNKPTDGGHLILSPEERLELIASEPDAETFVRRYMGGGDFINGVERYCLWLVEARPEEIRALPMVSARIEAVRQFRLASRAASTRAFAEFPMLFRQISQPAGGYLAVPEVSSERRRYIPIAFLSSIVVCSNTVQFVSDATPWHFGVLTSEMHMAWIRTVCGRLKSDFRYSNGIVYNNFPWPESPTDAQRKKVEVAAQGVLDTRDAFPDSTLADLYDPLTMPAPLVKAHQALDRVVDAAYGKKRFKSDADRVAFLFELYQKYTSLLPSTPTRKKARRKRAAKR
jgi:restriction-modification enzyme MmeI-like protein